MTSPNPIDGETCRDESAPPRTIAIGDIHGHALALARLIEAVQPRPQDMVVILGDVIDWGPDSRGVIEQLIELGQRCHLIPLLGNHEEMLLDARTSRFEFERWAHSGGLATLESYGMGATWDAIPEPHFQFLESCRSAYETGQNIFVHANYCWYSSLNQQPGSLLRWTSVEELEPRPHLSGKTVILGHAPGSVRDWCFCRCIDTGCGFGGYLTAMEVRTGQCWQVSERGELQDANDRKGVAP